MSIDTQTPAQEILDALREIQDSPELFTAAAANPESVMDRLKLSGIARHAVALGITAMLVAPVAGVTPDGWWAG